MTPNGYVLHEDAERVVIVTGCTRDSANAKTGPMLQVWILDAKVNPIESVQTGSDSVVCGDCIHRGKLGTRTCYVQVDKAPRSIWTAWKRGKYPFLPKARYADVFTGKVVRWGAYGDPRYIPLEILRWGSFFASGWTGYTHGWKDTPHLREYLMASVDTQDEYATAKSQGWRTFRVRGPNDTLNLKEISCPASDEAGHRTTCAKCRLCNGKRRNDLRADIAIVVHGMGKRNFPGNNLIQIGA